MSRIYELAVLFLITSALLFVVFRQRRRTIHSFRIWLWCEGLPMGLGIFVMLVGLWLLLSVFM